MRRKDKEVESREVVDEIIQRADVCRLGLSRENRPYVVPLSFGYDGQCLYFHTAQEGKKIDWMLENPTVCFEMEYGVKVIPHDALPCKWTQSFCSVIGYGEAQEILDPEQKTYALNQIMRHYSGQDWDIEPAQAARIRAWRVVIAEVSGKKSKDQEL